jgi:hypothetical protein
LTPVLVQQCLEGEWEELRFIPWSVSRRMSSPYTKGFFTAFTIKGTDGILREIKSEIQVEIPELFPGFSHDYFSINAIWDTGATSTVIANRQ